LGVIKLPSGEFISEDEKVLNHMLSCHFPGSLELGAVPNEESQISLGGACSERWELAEKIVCLKSVSWAINTFKPYKAAGVDEICPILLQKGSEVLHKSLQKIFTASLALGHIPEAWRDVRIVFIPKPGRASYEEAKSFRAISLSSFLLKTLERTVERYISLNCLKMRPLQECQHAYQRGKSQISAIHKVTHYIEKADEEGDFVLLVIVDVEGAFDRTTYESIAKSAAKFGIPRGLVHWIVQLLSRRILNAELKGTRKRMHPRRGCPQGGVLSPLFWSLVADDLLKRLRAAGLTVVGYADDFAILVRGKFLGIVFERMQVAMKIIEKWCEEMELSVNPDKTSCILFTKKRKLDGMKKVKLFGKDLMMTDQVKYLGIILDSKLSWIPHIESKVKKACMIFGQCRRAIGKTWGLQPKSVKWIYTAVVRPVISYGSLVWWQKTTLKTVMSRLNHLQRMVCLAMTGAMRTTPTAGIEAILGLPPLHIFVESVARKDIYRLSLTKQLCFGPFDEGHSKLWKIMTSSNSLWHAPCDTGPVIEFIDTGYEVVIASRDDWSEETELRGDIVFYTDGSRQNGKTGVGIYSENPVTAMSISIGNLTSVFQAELYGILNCASICIENNYINKNIDICSDSQAALRALSGNKLKSGLLIECRTKLQKVAINNSLRLVWVPGHSGFAGNEIADGLAREGSSDNFIGPEPALPLSQSWFREEISSHISDCHRKYWESLTTCQQTKLYLTKPASSSNEVVWDLSKNRLRILVGILTGHFQCPKHLHTMGLVQSALCDRCESDEGSTYHLVCNCPAFAQRRLQFFGKASLNLTEFRLIKIKDLINFISIFDSQ
jgi:ribonuclease HI